MTCAELVELVTAFLEGALDPDTERRFIEHLAVCDGCETYVDQMRRTVAEVGQVEPESLSEETRDRLLEAFRTFPREWAVTSDRSTGTEPTCQMWSSPRSGRATPGPLFLLALLVVRGVPASRPL
jgi:anti-sigma factor RsiW